MRIAVVGAGIIVRDHLRAYAQCDAQVVAVVDIDVSRAQKVAKECGAPEALTDYRVLLDRPDIDVIDICTPPRFHREIAVASLEAGKHVVCEKPLAANLADADAILAAEAASKGRLLTVHQLRFHPEFRRLEWLVRSGHLGKINLARVHRYDPPPKELVERGVWGSWELAGGGVLMTKAIHQLDLMLWLIGPVRRVQAAMGTFVYPIESEDQLIANLIFENGAFGSLCISGQTYAGRAMQFDLFGASATVDQLGKIRSPSRAIETALQQELDRRFPLPPVPATTGWKHGVRQVGSRFGKNWYGFPPDHSHGKILNAFLESLATDKSVPVTGTDGRQAVELCTAIYSAALTGMSVELPLPKTHPYYGGIHKNDYRPNDKE